MEQLGADLFPYKGKDLILFVDRFLGYPFVKELRSSATKKILSFLKTLIHLFGALAVIRADSGPQFRSKFEEFCHAHSIKLETSSPYHPESNGLAEVSVREVKRLLKKCAQTGQDFHQQLAACRCLPLTAGLSPAEAFLGRRPRSSILTLSTPLPDLAAFSAKQALAAAGRRHQDCTILPMPTPGLQGTGWPFKTPTLSAGLTTGQLSSLTMDAKRSATSDSCAPCHHLSLPSQPHEPPFRCQLHRLLPRLLLPALSTSIEPLIVSTYKILGSSSAFADRGLNIGLKFMAQKWQQHHDHFIALYFWSLEVHYWHD
ncbi:hypothetical protein TCAL_16914 [Tigriopus californicus]|uniref:Integrase catalytic domain-containing protein n=1 Tax=Tigriopus californicus TaxID=6832 RepID=A0A553P6T0_TIGCA|nr:hypothetical protein TCAL_16914 [Tigriopus californicus]